MLIPPVTDFILSSIVLEALSLACLIAEEIISSNISTVSASTAVGFSGFTASADNLIDLKKRNAVLLANLRRRTKVRLLIISSNPLFLLVFGSNTMNMRLFEVRL